MLGVTEPGRSISGCFLVQSTIVDSIPTKLLPPFRTTSLGKSKLPSSSVTSPPEVAETAPNLFALGGSNPGFAQLLKFI